MGFKQFKLDTQLHKGISIAGYQKPTPIQLAAIPRVLEGKDIIGTAQTGTGKTAAFVLPILNKLLKGPRGKSRVLIITPTRELAEQIHEAICELGVGTGIRSATIYGGVGFGYQIKVLREGFEILVACPGRLLDHIKQKNAKLDAVEILVLDEADRMLDMGFMPSVKEILQKLPSERQTLFFSATFPDEIEKFVARNLKNPERIAIGISRPAFTVKHALYPVSQRLKSPLLKLLLERTRTESVLIFTRTKYRTKNLETQIERWGYKVTSLHGNRNQSQRQGALNGFKDRKYQIMVATDIAARGLDVESITHVINFDIPDTVDGYIHRIGRTGRAERNGDAFTLVTPEDGEMIRNLEKVMGQKLDREFLKDFDYEAKGDHKPRVGSKNSVPTARDGRVGRIFMGKDSKAPYKERTEKGRYKVQNDEVKPKEQNSKEIGKREFKKSQIESYAEEENKFRRRKSGTKSATKLVTKPKKVWSESRSPKAQIGKPQSKKQNVMIEGEEAWHKNRKSGIHDGDVFLGKLKTKARIQEDKPRGYGLKRNKSDGLPKFGKISRQKSSVKRAEGKT